MIIYFMYGTIGELLMTINALKIIYEKNPQSQFAMLTSRNKGFYDEILTRYPFVRVYSAHNPLSYLKLFFTKNIVIRQQTVGPTSPKILALCKALTLLRRGKVVAFDEPAITKFSHLCTDTYLPFNTDLPFFENILQVVSACGTEVPKGIAPRFDFAEQKNDLKKPYIIIHPMAASEVRTFPLKRWPALIGQMRQKWPQYNLYITGSRGDGEKLAFLKDFGVELIAGKPSFHELAEILCDAALYIGVDTGVTHLASMVRGASIVLGNNAYPTWLPTYNSSNIILTEKSDCICKGNKTGDCFRYIDGKKYYRCLADISDEAILRAISEKLK